MCVRRSRAGHPRQCCRARDRPHPRGLAPRGRRSTQANIIQTGEPRKGQRAIAAKAPRHRGHLRQRRHFRICNLQNLRGPVGFESHSLRQFSRRENWRFGRSVKIEVPTIREVVSKFLRRLRGAEARLRATESQRHRVIEPEPGRDCAEWCPDRTHTHQGTDRELPTVRRFCAHREVARSPPPNRNPLLGLAATPDHGAAE